MSVGWRTKSLQTEGKKKNTTEEGKKAKSTRLDICFIYNNACINTTVSVFQVFITLSCV